MKHQKLLLMVIATAAFQAAAETTYRSVDEQGNVTFSDKPASGAAQEEQVTIDAPAPSAERQQETRQRESELQQAADQAGASGTPSQADQKKAARKAVQDAEKDLEEARQVREGDRKGTASGGSRLTPEYLERVREAEAEVDRARQQAK
jgi:flagellar motor protein MotB